MAQESKYVVFKLGEEKFGLPIESVERILPVQSVTPLPKAPKMFLGVFDLRGSTIPAIDARTRFSMPEVEDQRNFVVVITPEGRCALRVDEVAGIHAFDEDQVEWEGVLLEGKNDPFFKGIGKRNDELTLLLDPQHIVPSELKSRVASAA